MLEIEFEEPQTSVCECCGGTTTRLTRFVSLEGDALGIYYAVFAEKHPRLIGIVSLGEWWEDEVPKSRVAFAFEIWSENGNYNVGMIDADTSEWADVRIIGRKLRRDEALKHPWLKDVFHITDHMTAEDPEVKRFFEGETTH